MSVGFNTGLLEVKNQTRMKNETSVLWSESGVFPRMDGEGQEESLGKV